MDSPDPAKGHLPDASQKIAPQGEVDWIANPKRRFQSPEMLMEDVSLSDAEKLALLQEWQLEVDNRLKAEEEGMSASDPISSSHEGRLADETARIRDCIVELAGRIGRAD
jgi:hypothetical protein